MFTTWGRIVAAYRWPVLVLSTLTLVLAVVVMVTAGPDLSAEGFVSDDAESSRVDQALEDEYGRDGDVMVLLFAADPPVSDPATQAAVDATLAPAVEDDRVLRVLTTWSTGNPGMVSNGGMATYAVVVFAAGTDLSHDELDAFREKIAASAETNGLEMTAGGGMLVGGAIADGVEEGLVRAEVVSIPLTVIILAVVFGSLVAVGLPLMVGVFAILAALAVIFFLSRDTFQSVFAINVITMLGLGLGIDYALFMVTRFRQEIAHRPVPDALAVTMGTVGKAIFASGVTVFLGLAATQFFPLPALQSMGQAGMVVTAAAVVFGLTLLPALMAVLGPRVNALPIRRRHRQTPDNGAEGGFWHDVAHGVMIYPVPVMAALLVVLLVAGLPVLQLDLTPGGPDVLPEGASPRLVSERLVSEFPGGDADAIPLLVTIDAGDPTSIGSVAALRQFTSTVAGLDGVARFESFVAPEMGFDWDAWNGDPATLPAPVQAAVETTVRGNTVLIGVSATGTSADQEQLVRDIRAIEVDGLEVQAGGSPAAAVDTVDGIMDGIVPAAIFVAVGSYLILLLTFGSVFLPLKAIFMTLLSISASLGAVIWVFQEGHLEGLFGFQASGEIISTTPILMFCILFGLSMDYEVLMLSRIQEEYERTGDNRVAVATGLEQTAKVITGAALIMVVVFGGFMLADIVVIKSLGFGLALAVLIDATIVRGLLVPATMRLMGRWNWWAPAPVRRVVDRLGFGHRETVPAR